MAIISNVGRKNIKTRALHGAILLVLILGAITMTYPFLLMIAGSGKSAVDVTEMNIIPAYLIDDNSLWKKYAQGVTNESLIMMRSIYHEPELKDFANLTPPGILHPSLLQDWKTFIRSDRVPDYSYVLGFMSANMSRTTPEMFRKCKEDIVELYDDNVDRFNHDMEMDLEDWTSLVLPNDNGHVKRRDVPIQDKINDLKNEFVAGQREGYRCYISPEAFYHDFLMAKYGRDIFEYNTAHNTSFTSYRDIHLSRRLPTEGKRREDWEEFVRILLNLEWIHANKAAQPAYQDYLQGKYRTIETLNKNYGTKYTSFADIPIVQDPSRAGIILSDWSAFVEGWKDPDTNKKYALPMEMITLDSTEFRFQDYCKDKYKTLAKANQKWKTNYTTWADVMMPQKEFHYQDFLTRKGDIRWEFATRNFKMVIDYIILRGNGVLNTVIYCCLSILGAIIVNPLAAYALSRYKPPTAYKVLFYLMLTMSFPPLVTMIPSYLMLREFNLLNTFWALILPGLANGYMIFMLKGFFDSIPKELYEAASLDGANELRMFWQFTMALSKPILAVIALQAFNIAYQNFMFALLICPDKKMWTLMVWLYELQGRVGTGVIFSSLLIAAIPTFLIFAFCQNIIMRGIVVPTEK